MSTVHTEYGPGRIIDQETVRGRTRYKVAGEGFEVWLDQTKLGGYEPPAQIDYSAPHWHGHGPDDAATYPEPLPPLSDDEYAEYADPRGQLDRARLRTHPDYLDDSDEGRLYARRQARTLDEAINDDYDDPYAERYEPEDMHALRHQLHFHDLDEDDPARYSHRRQAGPGEDFADRYFGDIVHDDPYSQVPGDNPGRDYGLVEHGEPWADEEDEGRHYSNRQVMPGKSGRPGHLAWAPLDDDNSTDLPYNPSPQHDAVGRSGHDDDSATLQPIHHIDADERLHPSDSISFDDADDDDEPGPNPDLFAKQAAHPILIKHLREMLPGAEQAIQKRLEETLGLPPGAGKKLTETGEHAAVGGAAAKGATHHLDRSLSGLIDFADPGDWNGIIHDASLHQGGPEMALLGPVLRAVAPMALNGLMGHDGGEPSAHGPGGGLDMPSEGLDSGDWNGTIHDAYRRPAGLSDKYIDITAGADYHNDPVAQFRHDPDAYINRIGHLMDEGLNPRFAEYMDLVEADSSVRTAAWKDVRAKAMRLKTSGAVHVKDMSPSSIMASVDGDHGTYDVAILKGASYGDQSIANWHCGCEWGKWAFRRKFSYVGRLCSHAYASYLTMQSAAVKGQPRTKRGPSDMVIVKRNPRDRQYPMPVFAAGLRTAAEEPYEYVDDNRLCKRDGCPASKIGPFGYCERHEPRQPWGERTYDFINRNRNGSRRTADNLQEGPQRLTPELVVNDADDAHMFLDVTKDERKDTGPDDVVSDKDIVHFARLMRHCEVTEQPYPRQLVAFLARYAGCADDASDDTQADYQAHDADDANEYLRTLRSDAERGQEGDFGDMADRVHAIQRAVEEARAHGADADRFVAMVRQADDKNNQYTVTQDGGRTLYRGPNNKGYALENGTYTPVDYTGKGSQGSEGNRYNLNPDAGTYTKSTENGRDLYRRNDNSSYLRDRGFAVQNGDVRGVNFTGEGEQGSNQRFDYNGDYTGNQEDFQNFLKSNPSAPLQEKPKAGEPVKPGQTPVKPGQTPVKPAQPTPAGVGGNADASGDAAGTGGKAGDAGGNAANSKAGGGYTGPDGKPTSGDVADGGVAGAENGNNSAITKTSPNVDANGMYTVQKGDTWTDIAQRATGDMNNYQKMYDAQGGKAGGNIDSLAEGTQVNLKDFLNDTGNNNVRGDVTNPVGGGADKNLATPDVDVSAVGQSSYANGKSTAPTTTTTPPPTAPAPAVQDAQKPAGIGPAPASLRTAKEWLKWAADGDGSATNQTSPSTAQDNTASASSNPASGPSAPTGTRSGPATSTTPNAPGTPRPEDMYDATDVGQLRQQNSSPANPGAQAGGSNPGMSGLQQGVQQMSANPASMGSMVGDIGGMVGNAVGSFLPGLGGAISGISQGVGGLMNAFGGGQQPGARAASQVFASREDFDDWVRYAYPTADGEGELEPHTHPFAGSGYPGPLEIGTSEDYADKARKKHDDVTDLGDDPLSTPMGKWQRQSARGEELYAPGYSDEDRSPIMEEDDLTGTGWNDDPRERKLREDYARKTGDDPWGVTASIGYSTDDDSDIVRTFQAHLGDTALGAGAGQGAGRFDDIAGAAQGFLRTAGRNYSLAEQSELIREGDKGGARNLDSLDLKGTHYEDMQTLGW